MLGTFGVVGLDPGGVALGEGVLPDLALLFGMGIGTDASPARENG